MMGDIFGPAYQMLSPDELVAGEWPELVAVKVDGGGVHRDELGDVRMASFATVNDIGRPGHNKLHSLIV